MATVVQNRTAHKASGATRSRWRLAATKIPLPMRRRLVGAVRRVLFPPGRIRWRRIPKCVNLVSPTRLIDRAARLAAGDDIDALAAGALCRSAVETHLRGLARRLRVDFGSRRSDNILRRLVETGCFDTQARKTAQRLLDRASRCVHNERSTDLDVRALVENSKRFIAVTNAAAR